MGQYGPRTIRQGTGVGQWDHLMEGARCQPSAVVIWLGGNDAYPVTPSWYWRPDGVLWERIKNVVRMVPQHYDVYLQGPTPRPRTDGRAIWEVTPGERPQPSRWTGRWQTWLATKKPTRERLGDAWRCSEPAALRPAPGNGPQWRRRAHCGRRVVRE